MILWDLTPPWLRAGPWRPPWLEAEDRRTASRPVPVVVGLVDPPVGNGGTNGLTGGRGVLAGDVMVMGEVPIASGLTALTRIAPSTDVDGTTMPTPTMLSIPVITTAGAIGAVRAGSEGGIATMAVVSKTAVATTATVIAGTGEASGGGTAIPSVRPSPTDRPH